MNINSYPTVYALGHRAIADILGGPVIVEEKIDGSQFSFGIVGGELMCRSKGKQLILDAPEKMFGKAVKSVMAIASLLQPEWIYRGEYLEKPKHNTLVYDRVPRGYIVIFDVMVGVEQYLLPDAKRMEAERIGLECVPVLLTGVIENTETFKQLLETNSILGGQKVEGVVVKNYNLFTIEKKVAIGKFVSEIFKEIHGGEWRKSNPTTADIVDQLIGRLRTPARWQKAVQHLTEAGELEGSPRDIGSLIKEVPNDILEETEDEIRDTLFDHFWPKIRRGVTAGLPEWYKEHLLSRAFDGNRQTDN